MNTPQMSQGLEFAAHLADLAESGMIRREFELRDERGSTTRILGEAHRL
ncbi:hypothetical protein RHECNPAF_12600132 [Rhizobium etli CNPAF512]|nr:hypothetical protein RHECNPAF_12600132 [Rhizobium etli CNPAF512]